MKIQALTSDIWGSEIKIVKIHNCGNPQFSKICYEQTYLVCLRGNARYQKNNQRCFKKGWMGWIDLERVWHWPYGLEDQLDLEGSGWRLDCWWQALATGQLPCTLHLAMQWSFNISNVNCRRNTCCTRVLISLSTHNAHCGGFATGTGQLSTSSATAALPPAPTCAFQPLWCARGFDIFNISDTFNISMYSRYRQYFQYFPYFQYF